MSKQAFDEIDAILARTSRLYLAYTVGSAPLVWASVCRLRSRWLVVLPLTLLVSGVATWVHCLKTYDEPSIHYLRAGLDPQYPTIKDEVLRKNK